jgi:hypothetical protein
MSQFVIFEDQENTLDKQATTFAEQKTHRQKLAILGNKQINNENAENQVRKNILPLLLFFDPERVLLIISQTIKLLKVQTQQITKSATVVSGALREINGISEKSNPLKLQDIVVVEEEESIINVTSESSSSFR